MGETRRWGRAPKGTPPRVPRTFAFVDLCGFTDYADQEGDDQAAEVLHLLRATLRETATNHGVRVEKWLGDGAMLTAVEPAPLLAAVIEAKWAVAGQLPLGLRGGAAAGPVMVFEGDDYVGRPINLASKLCELAEPGQLLAPAALADSCPVGLATTPLGPLRVRGFAEPVATVAIDVSGDDAGGHRRGLGAAVGSALRDGMRQHESQAARHEADRRARVADVSVEAFGEAFDRGVDRDIDRDIDRGVDRDIDQDVRTRP